MIDKRELQDELNNLENQLRQLRVREGEISAEQKKNAKTEEGKEQLSQIYSEMTLIQGRIDIIEIDLKTL